MRKKCLVLLIISIILAVGLSGCQDTPSVSSYKPSISQQFIMTETGGVINTVDAPISIAFMEDAVQTETTITIKTASNLPSDSKYVRGTAFDFGPNGISFQQPVQLSISYDPTDIPADVNEGTLRLAKLVNNQWQIIENSWVNTTIKKVSGIITGFSTYSVRGNNVVVSVDPKTATCVLGGSVQFSSSVMGVPEDLNPRYDWKCSDNYGAIYTNNKGLDAMYIAGGNAVSGGTDKITLILTIEFGLSIVYISGENGIEDWFYDQTDFAVIGVAQSTVTIQEFTFSIEPASAKCAAGSDTGFIVVSNGLPDFENKIEYRWTCSNMYGNYFTDAPDDSAIAYIANEKVPDDSTDYIMVEVWAIYDDGSSKKLGEATASVTISSVNLAIEFNYPYEDGIFDIRLDEYFYIDAVLTNKPTGELLYVWDIEGDNTEGMLGGFGYNMEQHYETTYYDISFRTSGLGADGLKVPITCSVYLVKDGKKELLEKASTTFEIYMPSQIYTLCGSPSGDIAPRLGSGSSWSFYHVGHRPIFGGSFYARTGDQIRIVCNYVGSISEYLTYDIYIRKGYTEDPPSETQLIVKESEIVEGLDKTVTITI